MKQFQDPCSGPTMDSRNYWKCALNFLSLLMACQQKNLRVYSNTDGDPE